MNALGLDIGATRIRASLLLDGSFRHLGVWRTPPPSELHEALLEIGESATRSIDFVGIGLAGGLSLDGHVVSWPNRPDYLGFPLVATVTDALGTVPQCLDDCAASAVGEHVARCSSDDTSSTLYVGVGTGVGGGAIIGGRLHRGATGNAFAFGHWPTRAAQGQACRCGATGCLQSIASGAALDREGVAKGFASGTVAAVARDGHVEAARIISTAVLPLAEVLSVAIRLLDPERLVVGGGVANAAGEALLLPLGVALRRLGVRCDIEPALLGTWSGSIGAIATVAESAARAALAADKDLQAALCGRSPVISMLRTESGDLEL